MKKHRQEFEHFTDQPGRAKSVLSGLLIGGLVGAGTALLFAPQAGEKTRADIQHKTMELRDRTTEGVKDAVSQVKNKTRQVTSNVIGKAQELTQHGKEVLDERMDEMTETVNNRKKAIQNY